MATLDLVNGRIEAETNKDTVIIDKIIETVRGGRVLDVTGFTDNTIQSGHVILLLDDEYVPQPVDGSIPVGAVAVGILIGSIRTDEASAAIMTRGTVNEVPLKYPITAATKTALGDRIAYVLTP